jgi:uncharacterized protein
MWCHLSSLAWLVLPIPYVKLLAPFLIWSLRRGDHPFVDDNGKEAFNFQLSMTIYWTIAGVLSVTVFFLFNLSIMFSVVNNAPESLIGSFSVMLLFIGASVIITLFEAVLAVFAAIKANNGEFYRYPLTLRFFK